MISIKKNPFLTTGKEREGERGIDSKAIEIDQQKKVRQEYKRDIPLVS